MTTMLAHRHGWFTESDELLRHELMAQLVSDVVPRVDGWEREEIIPLREVLRGLASRGQLGRRFPASAGGQDGSAWEHVVLAECLGAVGSESLAMCVTVHNDMVAPMIAEDGSAAAIDEFLRPALRGECLLAHAVSEVGAGSDVAAVQTSASAVAGGYLVSGVKRWIVAGEHADAFVVLAKLPDPRPPFGYVLLMVPRVADGVEVVPGHRTLGLRAAGVAEELRLHDVFVPDGHRLAGHGFGLVAQLRQFESERIVASCRALASAERILHATRRHVGSRETFGEKLADRQFVGLRLAALEVEVEACRQLAYDGIDRWVTGRGHQAVSAAVKLSSSRILRAVAELCLHLHGAEGQRETHPMNRAWRDTRLASISTGSDEMMLTSIARLARWSR